MGAWKSRLNCFGRGRDDWSPVQETGNSSGPRQPNPQITLSGADDDFAAAAAYLSDPEPTDQPVQSGRGNATGAADKPS